MRIKVGGNVQVAQIMTRVPPIYPDEARQHHIEGRVVLHAVIGVEGGVKDLTVISGPQELAQSALDAVKQWRYKQTLLNGEPVEVDTTVTVDFRLKPSPDVATTSSEMPPLTPDTPATLSDPAALLKREHEALANVDPETAADIRRLLEVTGADKLTSMIFNSFMGPIREELVRSLPASEDREKIADRFIQKMEERASSGELIDVLIPIYAKHFTHEDLKNSLAFFESPSGRHFLQEQPAYLQEVQTAASEHWKEIVIPELLREMVAEFPQLGKKQ
jgi:TonB family protein